MISICISLFGFVKLTVAVKLVLQQPNDHKYFSAKTANACIFSKVTQIKILVSRQSHRKIWAQQQTANPIHDPLLAS